MKILMANKFYKPVGGPETVLFDTSRELEAIGNEVIPFAMSDPANERSKYSRYFVSNVDYNRRRGPFTLIREAANIIYSREAAAKMKRLVRDTDPDVAHMHNIYHQMSPSILRVLSGAGVPTVMTLHDGKLGCANMLFLRNGNVCELCKGRRFFHAFVLKCVKSSYASSLVCALECSIHRMLGLYENNVDLFISPSRFLRDRMVEYGRISEKQIEVIPNYADCERISPSFDPGGYVLYLGKIEEFKGVSTLLEASRGLNGFPIIMAGRGPLLESGRREAEREGLNVKYVGFQTGYNLLTLIQGARCLVLPSEWYENCPMVILEAFAAGKPVVASDIGGIPELVSDGEDGFLFRPGNPLDLARCLSKLTEDPALAERMGREGRNKVAQRFSLDEHIRSLLMVYSRVRGL